MNSELIKESLLKFTEVLPFNYPAVGWYFSSEEIEKSFIFRKNKWVCMFMYVKMMMNKGKRVRFSGDCDSACTGPAEFFGFTDLIDDGGVFIAETERFKKILKFQKHIPGSRQLLFIHQKVNTFTWKNLKISTITRRSRW